MSPPFFPSSRPSAMLPLLLLSLFLVAQPPAIRGQPAEQNIFPAFDYYSERLNSGHWNGKRLTAGNTTIRLERDIIEYDRSGWTAEQMDALTNDTYCADKLWTPSRCYTPSCAAQEPPACRGLGILSPFKTRGYTKCAVISSSNPYWRPYADLIIDAIRRENMTLTLLMDIPGDPANNLPLIALGYAADEAINDTYGNWTFEHQDPLNPGTNKTYGPKLLGNNHLGEDFAQGLKDTGIEVLFHHGFADSLTLGPDNYDKMNMDVENEFNQILIDKGVDLKASRSINQAGTFRDAQIATADTYYQYGAHNLTDFLLTNAEWTSKVNCYDAFLDVWSSDLIADYNAWPNRTTDYDRMVNQHLHAAHLLAIAISMLTEWSPDMDTNRAAIKAAL
ncbi:unnamed protein product [Vitrella brassicaformis CCMP3155]|uniref:Uncharacterized protein n=1 Tax=Vitrella brassicaformis (strain CCMP3155) TaxID=1169540 RepID=A0A0G4H4A3_VITBC|nr:unnamed protein product [Vitrella brassicaformis CCMP3155]|eukprot:CEM38592.1 unnamed protein product [Vitrella brassicaformis CCMP3155]